MKEWISIRCRDVAMLLDTEQLATERCWRRLMVRLHLATCRPCRAFERQRRQLRAVVHVMRASIDAESSDPALEERIARKLGLTDRVSK